MARIVGFRPYHLGLIELQAEQVLCAAALDHESGEALLQIGPAWSCVDENQVYGCAGFWDQGEFATAWALLSRDAGQHFAMIHRAVVRAFRASRWNRIETHVRQEFEAGERWAVSLGMIRMRMNDVLGPDGSPYALWMFHG